MGKMHLESDTDYFKVLYCHFYGPVAVRVTLNEKCLLFFLYSVYMSFISKKKPQTLENE